MLRIIFLSVFLVSIVVYIVRSRRGKKRMIEDEEWESSIGNYKNERSTGQMEQIELKKELDRLLEKISKKGLNSLSRRERFKLDNISHQLKDD